MPFTTDDAVRHNSALKDKPAACRQWVAVANSVLKKCMDDGGDDASCAGPAIRQANGVVAAHEMSVYWGQAANYTIREELLQGRAHLVVPVIMMTQGVHRGSHGPILHLADELGKFPGVWDGIPVVVSHPQVDGQHVSANSPDVLDQYMVGRVFNTVMDGQKLRAEAWLDPEALRRVSPEAMAHIKAGKPMDVSVGVFTDEDMQAGDYGDEHYEAVARNHRADHLALLPGAVGACSWSDGCGVRAYHSWPDVHQGVNHMEKIQTNAIKFGGTEGIPWAKPTLADFGKGGNWSAMEAEDRADIANHFLIGDDSASNYGELMFPVVNPKSGKLNENALRAVIGGRGAQANITAAQRISARRQAYRLLNSEFNADLQVLATLAADIAAHEEQGLKELARLGFSINEIGAQNQQDIEDNFNPNHDGKGRFASGSGGGGEGGNNKDQKGLRATAKANMASNNAPIYGGSRSAGLHREAAKLHTEAAGVHRELNNVKEERFHVKMAISHNALARQADKSTEGQAIRLPARTRITFPTFNERDISNFEVYSLGYRELSQAIQMKLDRMDDDTKVNFLEDCFDGYFIYRVEPKAGAGMGVGGPNSTILFKRNYTVAEDGTVEFTGESMPVIKRVSYDPVSQQGGMRNMSKQPCCKEKVQMLIESGLYQETDRDRLEALEEADINVLTASVERAQAQVNAEKDKVTALEAEKATIQANAAQGTTAAAKELQTLRESLGDQEKLMGILPPKTKAVISHSLRLYEAERERKIGHILANTVEGVYTKETLAAMDDQSLENLARAIKAPQDYSALAPTPLNNNSRSPQGYESEAVYPPDVN